MKSIRQNFPVLLYCIFLLKIAIKSEQSLPTYPYCYLGQAGGPGSISFDDCDHSPGSFVCTESNSCGLDHCYLDGGPKHKNCSCNACHLDGKLIERHLLSILCGCFEGNSGYCWCNETMKTMSNQNNHTYPDCYLGQIEGPGSMSFDNCAEASGSFVCNDSKTCGLDKCYGDGFQHENCSCTNCHSHLYQEDFIVEQHVECGCTPGADCWCDEVPHTTPNPNKHKYPDCYLGQIEGPGSMSFDNCIASPGSFVCNNTNTCGLDKCYGEGFKHENCRCEECHIHNDHVLYLVDESHIECGCTPNADCWCDEVKH